MPVVLESGDDELIAYLSGEIDHHIAGGIRDEIDEAIEKHKPKRLVLDFKNVTFMDSSGIGLVMGRYRAMQLIGGAVTVRGATLHIRKVMRLAGLDRLAVIE